MGVDHETTLERELRAVVWFGLGFSGPRDASLPLPWFPSPAVDGRMKILN